MSVTMEMARAMGEDYVDASNGRTGNLNRSKGNLTLFQCSSTFPCRFEISPSVRVCLYKHPPKLSSKQAHMLENLCSSLPGLRKHVDFFEEVRYSHAWYRGLLTRQGHRCPLSRPL